MAGIFKLLQKVNDNKISEDSVISAIQSGNYDLGKKTEGATPLIYACVFDMVNISLALIQSGKSQPKEVDDDGNTALIHACSSIDERMNEVALRLIATGNSFPDCINDYGSTALTYACYNTKSEIALKLIETGKSVPEQVDVNGYTALQYACENNMPEVALKLIETGNSFPDHVSPSGNTALRFACEYCWETPEVALKLIETGKSVPEQVNNYDSTTALIYACIHAEMKEVALKLIETGNARPEQVDDQRDTALLMACHRGSPEVALKLIETGNARPEHVDRKGDTALILSCENEMPEVALKLIETGNSLPGQVNKYGNTALIRACENGLSEVALKLIETGKSVPEQVNDNGNTALIIACQNGMTEVAQKLIETGNSLPEKVNNDGETAYSFAQKKGLTEIVNLLQSVESNIIKERMININDNGFDPFNQETKKVVDFVSESPNHLCLKLNDQYILLSKEQLEIQMKNPMNIKYGCIEAGDASEFIQDANIRYNVEYLSLSSLSSFQVLVDVKKIKAILDNSISPNLLYARPTQVKHPSIISKAFVDGGVGVSADHCQSGKETMVYELHTGIPICKTESVQTQPSPLSQVAEEANHSNQIIVQYKGQKIPLEVTETSTFEEVKTKLLTKLLAENTIDSMNQNVRFIYQGKIYTDPSIQLSALANPPFGLTLQAMVSPSLVTGGRQRKTRRFRKKVSKKKTRTNKQ